VWAYNLAQNHWLQLSPRWDPPEARNGCLSCWGYHDGVAFMFGGNTGAGYANDLSIYRRPCSRQRPWVLNRSDQYGAWTPVTPVGTPCHPLGPDPCLDRPQIARCSYFGSDHGNDLWRYDLASQLLESGPAGLSDPGAGFIGTGPGTRPQPDCSSGVAAALELRAATRIWTQLSPSELRLPARAGSLGLDQHGC